MDELALYLLKAIVCNAIFLGIYVFFLKKHTFFSFNRYFLLLGLLLSIVLPLYTYTHQVTVMASQGHDYKQSQANAMIGEYIWPRVLFAGYLLGTIVFTARYLFGLSRIIKVIRRSGFTQFPSYRLVKDDGLQSSFSVFNYIFINAKADLSETEMNLILAHEIAHVNQGHWSDLLLSQLFCILHWFSPLAWLYRKAIRENHEYLADQTVLQQGTTPAVYSALLVNQCIGVRVFPISSSFNLYKMSRLEMLSRPASASINKAVVFLSLPAICLFIMAFSKTTVIVNRYSGEPYSSKPLQPQVLAGNGSLDGKLPAKGVIQTANRPPSPLSTPPKQAKLPEVKLGTSPLAGPSKSSNTSPSPSLVLLDGIEMRYEDIDQGTIGEVRVVKDQQALKEFGERGRNGVMLLYTKDNRKLTEHRP